MANNGDNNVHQQCPYLDTINRKALDFDFEKLCSISLSKINVYACLVCGQYFQGRGKTTHAYLHSCSSNHHVFLNLETLKFYCLPDNYEIQDSSFNDIVYVLKPTFQRHEINQIDQSDRQVRAYDGTMYYPGIVGLNNLKYNDYCNVVLQALSHVIPLRNHFLLEDTNPNTHKPVSNDRNQLLAQRFGELIRKLWNPRNFKAHVSPHEMLQAVVLCSDKEFEFTKQGDPIIFLSWFLNSLSGPKRQKLSIIKQTFQGIIKVTTQQQTTTTTDQMDTESNHSVEESVSTTNFLYLTLDLPLRPLYPQGEEREDIKPQTSLYTLLEKFNGHTTHESKTSALTLKRKFQILKLPRYLILYIKRFTKNTFFLEKNPYIVNFPIKDLDMAEYLSPEARDKNPHTSYNLIANIAHEGEPDAGKGTYRAHILHKGTGKWFELQDLHVTDILPEIITLSESYIQVWEMADTNASLSLSQQQIKKVKMNGD